MIDPSGNYHSVAGAVKLWLAANPASTTIGAWVPDEPTAGLSFVAVSRETVRRIPKEHGLFLWCVQYRVDARGDARRGRSRPSGWHSIGASIASRAGFARTRSTPVSRS